jgi:hypothetical protein
MLCSQKFNVTISGKLLLFFAFLAGTLSAQTLSVNPSSLFFAFQTGQGTPPQQNVQVSGTPGLATTITTSSGTANWLFVNPTSGTTPHTLAVIVLPGSLPNNTYNGTITVSAPGATPVQVAVTLVVSNQPIVTTSPMSLTFSYGLNGPEPVAQTLNVNSTTPGVSLLLGCRLLDDGQLAECRSWHRNHEHILDSKCQPNRLSGWNLYRLDRDCCRRGRESAIPCSRHLPGHRRDPSLRQPGKPSVRLSARRTKSPSPCDFPDFLRHPCLVHGCC